MALLHKNRTNISAVCLAGCLCLPLLLMCASATGQTNRILQEGNQNYEQKKYNEAADDYTKAIKKDPNNAAGYFNLGNTLYQQQKFDSSRKLMTATEKLIKDKKGKAAANYNIGNSYMSQQKWEDAINAYKQTLRSNPQDVDAKYNLSYAEQMLKKQQQQQQQNKQNKDQKDKDKQNKDQKDKDKQQQNKDQKDNKDGQNKDQQDKQQQEPQGKPSTMSKQDAENQLNQLEQMEKKLQDKLNKEKGAPAKLEKDW
jgi:Ca-activated chloride channel homolog